MTRSPADDARLALACLDLTSLADGQSETEAEIDALCARADGPHGRVAAVCVWPRFAARARRALPAAIGVAAVANFPDGSLDAGRLAREIGTIADAGAQEVDVVLPWRALCAGDAAGAAAVLRTARRAAGGLTLKVILETGELGHTETIAAAARLALGEGADFLKTSTGKTRIGATPEAARTLLATIAADAAAAARVGFKASGGVRAVADAAVYLRLVEDTLGAAALRPQRFRLGASALLADIEAVLGGAGGAGGAGAARPGY